MFLGTLGATLLRNLLAGKVIVRAPYGKRTGNLMPSHSLTNFEIHKFIRMNQDLIAIIQEIICLKQ